MPLGFAFIGVILSFFQRYPSFAGAFLYGAVGWLIGKTINPKSDLRNLSARVAALEGSLEKAWDELLRLRHKGGRQEEGEKPRSTEEKPPLMERAPRTDIYHPIEKKTTPHFIETRKTEKNKPVKIDDEPLEERPPNPIYLFFTTGNVFAKVGALILFVGVSFLIKFVSELGIFPIEGRLIGTAVGSNILIWIGWRLREKRRGYALILQGTGFGVFFLTVFGAFRIWQLIPALPAMCLLVTATVLFSLLAVYEDAIALAALAVTGGFSAPILISTGSTNHVILFSYYSLLNLSVLFISVYKSWRELNFIGFLFTYGVGGLWGYKYYVEEHFFSVEPFLIFHFLIYVSVALLFSKHEFKRTHSLVVDGTLVFGVPLATFGYQAAMLKDVQYGISASCVALGVFYVILAQVLYSRFKDVTKPLIESFLASGLIFNTLAIPYALTHLWTSATWGLEGAVLVWAGIRLKKPLVKYFGLGLQFLAYVAFFIKPIDMTTMAPLMNAAFIGSLTLFFSALGIAYLMFKRISEFTEGERSLIYLFFIAAFCWWFFGLFREVYLFAPSFYGVTETTPHILSVIRSAWLVIVGLSILVVYTVASFMAWPLLRFIRYFIVLGLIPLFWNGTDIRSSDFYAFINPFFIGCFLLSVSALMVCTSMFKHRAELPDAEKFIPWAFLVIGYWMWLFGFHSEVSGIARGFSEYEDQKLLPAQSMLFFVAVSTVLFHFLSRFFKVRELGFFRFTLTGIGLLCLFPFLDWHPLAQYAILGWPLLFIVHYFIMHREESSGEQFIAYQHFTSLWLLAIVSLVELYWVAKTHIDPMSVWKWVLLVSAPAVLSAIVVGWKPERFPFGKNKKAYLKIGVVPLLIGVTICSQYLNLYHSGEAKPLPYVPLINPLGALVAACLLLLVFWYLQLKKLVTAPRDVERLFAYSLGFLVFLWLTMGVIRSIHHYADVPWNFYDLQNSRLVQASLSIFWGLLALATMVFSNKKGLRALWIGGCALILVVIGKILVIDLGATGTLERIVSFIGTGIVLLLTGYFAPIPPEKRAK